MDCDQLPLAKKQPTKNQPISCVISPYLFVSSTNCWVLQIRTSCQPLVVGFYGLLGWPLYFVVIQIIYILQGRTVLGSRKFQHLYTHVLRSERANIVSITSYQMTKGPELHNAQQSLTDLIQNSTKVKTDMHANKTSHTVVPQTKPSHDLYYRYVPHIKGQGERVGCCRPRSPSLRWHWRPA